MSDLLGEGLISLAAAAALFPGSRGASRANPSTICRWCVKGTRTADGRVVKLVHVRAGYRVLTSRPALSRYLAALSGPGEPPCPPARTPAERTRAADRAGEELKRLGA